MKLGNSLEDNFDSNFVDCRYLARIAAYHDGQTDQNEQQEIQAHLTGCHACQRQLADLERLSRQLAVASAPPITPQFLHHLHANVMIQADNNLRRIAKVFLAAAACLFMGTAVWAWHTGAATQDTVVPWDAAAADPQGISTASSSNNNDVVLARWMVQDLSRDRLGSSGNE